MAADDTPPRARVALALMGRENVSLATHAAIFAAGTTGRLAHHLVVTSGPYLDAGRNKAVAGAMTVRDDWDWLLFGDTDVEFTLEQFDALFAPTLHPSYDPARYPVLGGIYVNPFDDGEVEGETREANTGQFGPVAYEWKERDDLLGQLAGVPTFTFVRLSRANLASRPPVNEPWNPPGTEASPSPICEVAAIGTGFLAIHQSLFDAMGDRYGEPLPWFDEPVHLGVHYGEDMGFALRCTEMGYPVLAHRGVTPLHHKTIKLI